MSVPKDITAPKIKNNVGALHPINQMKDYILGFLSKMGFEIIGGPEIETEDFNFDMLNIPATHPSREMHDTFYVCGKKNVLRTHTSPVQVRCML